MAKNLKPREKRYFHSKLQREARHQQGRVRFQKSTPFEPIGVRGLKTLGGLVNEEYRIAMTSWRREAKIYLEMRDDVTIGTLLDAVKLPLLASTFGVEPAPEQTPGDQAAADWLYDSMNRMNRQAWRSYVSDCLDALDFGFAVGEIVLEKRIDGRVWLKNIEPRGQETLYKWEWGEGNERDDLKAFVQQAPVTGEIMNIPIEKCIHITFRGRKGNPQGKSLLNSLFRPWRMCKDLENLEVVGVERDVGGMPVATLPEGALTSTDTDDLEDALKGMRNDENAYLVLPPGVEVSPYGGGQKKYDVGQIIDRKQKEILGRMFAQFLKLGMDKVGTQALVQGSQDFFTLGLRSVQENLLEAWNQQLVPFVMAVNSFPGMSAIPTITWATPGRPDWSGVINALNTATSSGLFTPTDIDEDHIRLLMHMPELPEEERGQPRDVEKAPVFNIPQLGGDSWRRLQK